MAVGLARRAADLRTRRIETRTAELTVAMLRPMTAMVEPEYAYSVDNAPVAVGVDLGAWLEMQGAATIGRCMFDAQYRAETIAQYIAARVRSEADRVDWSAKADEWLRDPSYPTTYQVADGWQASVTVWNA